ncbi:MAG TPA: GAF domain-containing protein [Anaerolineae bacterium]|nr:GAF domain-containing protein [Anaerolineae bacterium]
MHPFRILQLERDRDLAQAVQARFEAPLYHIEWQEDGILPETLSQYDLILIDESYVTILQMVWADVIAPPRLLLTGVSERAMPDLVKLLGAERYVLKTVDNYVDEVEKAVQWVLHRAVAGESKLWQQYVSDWQALHEAGQDLNALHDWQEIIDRLLVTAKQMTGAEGSTVWLWDTEINGRLICRAHVQDRLAPDEYLVNTVLLAGQGVAGWVAKHKESIVVNDLQGREQFANNLQMHHLMQTKSLVAAPLIVRDTVLGVLEIVNKEEGPFSPRDRHLVETLAVSAALALDNAALMTRLQQGAFELRVKNEELDAFAHTVAHNLRSKVAHLLGFAQMMQADWERLAAEDIELYLETMINSGYKMQDIIDELLLLSQIRNTEVQLKRLAMGELVKEVLERLHVDIMASGATIEVADEWPVAWGYGPWVEEAWINYVSNGLKYGGTPPHLVLGANEAENGFVSFWVEDNGQGLTAAQQKGLFTPFTRLNQVHVEGYGLGLSIVRRIMEKLGGAVWVESEVGKGSRFEFLLPGKVGVDE